MHSKCNVFRSSPNHPFTPFPTPVVCEHCLPKKRSLVPKRLRTTNFESLHWANTRKSQWVNNASSSSQMREQMQKKETLQEPCSKCSTPQSYKCQSKIREKLLFYKLNYFYLKMNSSCFYNFGCNPVIK